MHVAAVEVAMNAAVNQDNERQLALRPIGAGQERVGAEDHRIAGALAGRILDDPRRRTGVAHLVHFGHILQTPKQHQIVHLLRQIAVDEAERLLQTGQTFRLGFRLRSLVLSFPLWRPGR